MALNRLETLPVQECVAMRTAIGATGSGVQLATTTCIRARQIKAAIQRCERLER